MTRFLFAVQDATGHEITSTYADVDKVSEVTTRYEADTVDIIRGGEVLATGHYSGEDPLTLHRWNADDKLTDPVSHPVTREDTP
jgi:hypothetical protein